MKDLINIPNSLITEVIDEWVKGEINRNIFKDRYINKMCYEPLAEKYDLSVSTIKRTLDKYSPVVFKQLDKTLQEKENRETHSVMIALPIKLSEN